MIACTLLLHQTAGWPCPEWQDGCKQHSVRREQLQHAESAALQSYAEAAQVAQGTCTWPCYQVQGQLQEQKGSAMIMVACLVQLASGCDAVVNASRRRE